MINPGLMTSNKDTWETPQDLFDTLNEEFRFSTDVCANKYNAKCSHYFSKADNGLHKDWTGVCWMNPPYGKQIGPWIKKAYDESQKGVVVVGLLPARTDTRWFHDYIYNKATIRFIKGRLRFVGANNSAPFPSMIVIWSKPVTQEPDA